MAKRWHTVVLLLSILLLEKTNAQCSSGVFDGGSCGCGRYYCNRNCCDFNFCNGACGPCKVGSYIYTASNGNNICSECPPGSFSTITGANVCTPCPIGTFSSTSATSACTACVPGKFANQSGTADCTRCPSGTYAPYTGATACTSTPPIKTFLACNQSVGLDSRYGDTRSGPDGSVDYNNKFAIGDVVISDGSVTLSGFQIPRGVQIWTVAISGMYKLLAAGGKGACSNGRGIVVANEFYLNMGDTVAVMVGQQASGSQCGGGGGTFISKFLRTGQFNNSNSHQLILVAGGGGGNGNDAVVTTSGAGGSCGSSVATNGGGGGGAGFGGGNGADGAGATQGDGPSAGGGGFIGNGGDATPRTTGGKSFLNGGQGGCNIDGCSPQSSYGVSGFGGGGGAWNGGGGGGGYSGGAGCGSGGGGNGGSYDATNPNNGYSATQVLDWTNGGLGNMPQSVVNGYNQGNGFVRIRMSNISKCPADSVATPFRTPVPPRYPGNGTCEFQNLTWPFLTQLRTPSGTLNWAGGLGLLMNEAVQMWGCMSGQKPIECGQPACYVFNEQTRKFAYWGRNEDLRLVPYPLPKV